MKQGAMVKRLCLYATFIVAALASYYFFTTKKVSIYDFNEQRDTTFILDLFQKDWYWLVAGDFSPEYMLRYQSSSKGGNEIIKVLYKGTSPVGFVSYHREYLNECLLHFVAVKEEFRSKGYGLRLVKYAIKDMLARGCTNIKLVTRVDNYSAQAIYKKVGFKETERTNGFVHFEYKKF